jgi:hypothetical protein
MDNGFSVMTALSSNISRIEQKQIAAIADTLWEIWGRARPIDEMMQRNVLMYNINNPTDIRTMYSQYNALMNHLIHEVQTHMSENEELISKLMSIHVQLRIAYEGCLTLLHQKFISEGSPRINLPDMASAPFIDDIERSRKPHQELISLMIGKILQENLQKKEDGLYEPVFNADGIFVFTYKYMCSIMEYVYRTAHPNTTVWNTITDRPNNARMCAEHIRHCSPLHVPILNRNRSWFSFRNGVLDATCARFYPYTEGKFSPTDNQTCAVYHDQIYTEYEGSDPMDIPTPYIDQIILTQGMGVEELFIFHALLGRMLFPPETFDGWQAWVNMKGVGGCGKSTILEVVSKLYEPTDIGTLDSNAQGTFSFEHLPAKNILVIHDMDEKCKIPATALFVMISSEQGIVYQKFKPPLALKWNFQGIMAGNTWPVWAGADHGGSASRRIIPFVFPRAVKKSDPFLKTRCLLEMANIIQKGIKCYFKLIARAAQNGQPRDIWSPGVLPESFHKSRRQMMAECNPLQQVIGNEEYCIQEQGAICLFSDFQLVYQRFLNDHQIKTKRRTLNEEAVSAVFHSNNIQYVDPSNMIHQSQLTADSPGVRHIIGLRLISV